MTYESVTYESVTYESAASNQRLRISGMDAPIAPISPHPVGDPREASDGASGSRSGAWSQYTPDGQISGHRPVVSKASSRAARHSEESIVLVKDQPSTLRLCYAE